MSGVRRFAIVAPNFYPRVCGVGDHTARLGAELQRRGHEVAIISRQPAERHPDAPELEVRGMAGRWPTTIARHALDAIEDYGPADVLIQYTPQMWDAGRLGSPAAVWLAARARKLGARVTVIAHELAVPLLPRPDLALAAVVQRVHLAALVKTADRFFVTTETRAVSLSRLCHLMVVAEPGVVRVGPGALPVERKRQLDGDAKPGPRVGFFSTAATGKRFDVVLDAFERIASEIPAAELVLIGDLGPPDQRGVRVILDAIARHPAKARIRMTGRLSLPEIASEMAALDLYLFPMSTGANTRSSTLPVALGSGLPIVAVRGSETDLSLFRDGENVVFAREMTGAAFAEASLRLLRDPAALGRVAEGGRRLYETHLTWNRITEHLLAEMGR
jgi:glycosyltransferase involved in cell wall biosynthesis